MSGKKMKGKEVTKIASPERTRRRVIRDNQKSGPQGKNSRCHSGRTNTRFFHEALRPGRWVRQ